MLSKLLVFGAGYVLGTKAGRARYDQIASIAQAAARRLEVSEARNQVSSRDSWRDSRASASRNDYSRS